MNARRLFVWPFSSSPRSSILGLLGVLGVALATASGAQPRPSSNGETIQVAVAANFQAPMRELVRGFEEQTGHRVLSSVGATGAFYAQIRQGAPFDVLLAADDATPAKLVSEGLAVESTRMTYAVGRLVLWSAQPGLIDAKGEVLRLGPASAATPTAPRSPISRLAVANARVAPYGMAAQQVLQRLQVHELWRQHLVQGENIAQTHQFVASGNAQAGFVALSQVWANDALLGGSAWVVPSHLYDAIRQDAVVLRTSQNRTAAREWLQYLKSPQARLVMKRFGYDLP